MSARKHAKKIRRVDLELLENRCLLSATYYVSTNGSDSNNGTSAGSAFATLQQAADVVKAGDTVHVSAGTYVGMNLYGIAGGTQSAPITFLADPGVIITHVSSEGVNASLADINIEDTGGFIVINGFHIESDGSAQRAGIRVTGSNNTTIINNTVDDAFIGIFTSDANNLLIQGNTCDNSTDQHGIYMSDDENNCIVNGNTLYGNNWDGLHMNALTGDPNNGALVENNVIYGNGEAGMDIEGVTNATFENNLIYNNTKEGITLHNLDQPGTPPATGNVFVNNTIVGNGMAAIQLQSGGNTANTIYNNILLSSSSIYGSIVTNGPTTGLVSDYNIVMSNFSTDLGNDDISLANWQSTSGQDTHSLIATAGQLFVNPSGNNYQLKAGSPAIDAGTATDAPAIDIAGNPRPEGKGYDIGAYEYPSPGPAGGVTIPAVPTSLSATATSSTQINLSWSESSSTASFLIERSTDGGAYSQVGTAAVGATSYTDSGLSASTNYSYEVVATNSAGNSSASSSASATTQAAPVTIPNAPTSLTATATSASQINLSWSESSSTASFLIERSTNGGAYSQVGTAPAGATSYTDSGLTAGTQYSYEVVAKNSAGSAASTAASATTAAAVIAATSPATGTTLSVWNGSAIPVISSADDSNPVEVGVKFRSSVAGYITGISFYKGAGNTGVHIGHLWTKSGKLLATATFTNETATGWQTVTFAKPIKIQANTTYIASYHTTAGHYADDTGFTGASNGPLQLLSGVYAYTTRSAAFPTSTWESSNYWVDVLFTTTPPTA